MKYTSRVPRVTISPVFAPLRSISVLIAVVEPWISSEIAAQSTPLFFRQSTIPWTSRAGVVRLFACENRPVVSSNAIRSVNVPPISIATTVIPPESYRVWTPRGRREAHPRRVSCGREENQRRAPLPLVPRKRPVPALSRRGMGRAGAPRPAAVRAPRARGRAGGPVLVDHPRQARELPARVRPLRSREGLALRAARRAAADGR